METKKNFINFIKTADGNAVVQATILFPVMIMVFMGLVILSMYLPVRAALQKATQQAATAIAVERSDTWLFFDEKTMNYYWEEEKSVLSSVYVSFFKSVIPEKNGENKAESIVKNIENGSLTVKFKNDLEINFGIVNYFIYKEIIVTAARQIHFPFDLSLVGFPKEITLTVTSTAVVQNGDEFLRNIDLAVDFAEFIGEKLGIGNISEAFGSFKNKVSKILGWNG